MLCMACAHMQSGQWRAVVLKRCSIGAAMVLYDVMPYLL